MKKLVAEHLIHQLHDARGFERREREQQQEGGDELRPNEERQPHPGHPRARSWMIVAMKFTAPSSDEVIRNTMPISQSVWPFQSQ